jgi:opacity protein-like surface antigen
MTTFAFLLILLWTGHVSASETGKRLAIFAAGGRSYPVGNFEREAKATFNWGAGVELRFPSNWATGITVHGAQFEHQRAAYDSWQRSWRSVDWSFVRVNWYGKHFLRRTGIRPFLQGGIGIYYLEGRNTYAGQNRKISQTTAYSVVPGMGLEYSQNRFLVFVETDCNFVFRESIGGDLISTEIRRFFDLFLGVGFFISNP